MDPLHDIKCAEWGGVYPTSLIDIQFHRWKDEGQNLDAITHEKIIKQPMIFDNDPLVTEEAQDDLGDNKDHAEKLEKFMEPEKKEEPNLLKSIGKTPAGRERNINSLSKNNSGAEIATMPTGIGG